MLQKIVCESGLRTERETYEQVARWRKEIAVQKKAAVEAKAAADALRWRVEAGM